MADVNYESLLGTLNVTEAVILFWKCKKLPYKQIARKKFPLKIDAVQWHMSNVYSKLGFDLTTHATERWKILQDKVCPALFSLTNGDVANITKDIFKGETPKLVPNNSLLPLVREENALEESGKGIIVSPTGEIITLETKRKPSLIGLGLIVALITVAAFVVGRLTAPLITAAVPSPIVMIITATQPTPTNTVVATETQAPTATIVLTETQIPTNTPLPSPVGPTVLFEDNFDNGRSSSWQVVSGNPVIANDALTTDNEATLLVGDSSWVNYSVEFDALNFFHPGVKAGGIVGVRVQDPDNMIAFTYYFFNTFWDVVENGNWSEVPNTRTGVIGYPPQRIKITANGQKYTAEGNDGKISSFVNSKFSSGKILLKIYGGEIIDNFKVIQLPQ